MLALNCRWREEHCPSKCPFGLYFEYYNFLTTISTSVVQAALEFQHFLLRQIKCRGNYMKIHFASAFPRQCFCQGWQDFILRASVFTSATSAKTSTRSKLVKLLPLFHISLRIRSIMCTIIYKFCCTHIYAMQCALFSRQKFHLKIIKNNFGCFIWVQK